MGKRRRQEEEPGADMLVFEDEEAGTVVMVGGPVTRDPMAVASALEDIAKHLRARPGLAKAGAPILVTKEHTG